MPKEKAAGSAGFDAFKILAETRPPELLPEPIRTEALSVLAAGTPLKSSRHKSQQAAIFNLESALKQFQAFDQFNRDKILITLTEIEEVFPLQPGPTTSIQISLLFGRGTRLIPANKPITETYRIDVLKFLHDIDVVESYSTEHGFVDLVSITVIANAFKSFRAGVAEIITTKEVSKSEKEGTPIPLETERTEEANKDIVYQVRYTPAREVLVNNFQISRLTLNGENDLIFLHLMKKPNKTISRDELAQKLGRQPTKSLHKFVENLGFTGELKRLFFDTAKDSIRFHNPVSQKRLHELGITRLKFRLK